MVLDDFLSQVYLPVLIAPSSGHAHQLRVTLRLFGRFLQRPGRVADLTGSSIRSFLSWLKSAGRANATVNAKRRMLLALWRVAYQMGHLDSGPAHERLPVRALPRHLDAPEGWTPEEVGRLLSVCERLPGTIGDVAEADFWLAIVSLAYYTGLRIGTLTRLESDALDWRSDTLRVPAALTKTGIGRAFRIPHDLTVLLLACWPSLHQRLLPWPHSDRWLSERLVQLCRAAGLRVGRHQGGRWHKFRRTSGSLVEAAGGDGARHLGNSRVVFLLHYCDPRLQPTDTPLLLPAPVLPV